jgi:glycosyltransferase 2 family protein
MGLTSVRFVKRKWAFIFHTVFIWSMYLLSIRLGFYAMESVSHLGMRPSFTILSFGSLAMIITQGGIGAYQLAVQKTLTLYGIAEVDGLAYGWLLWAVQTLMVLVVGLVCLLLLPIFNRQKNESIRQNSAETDVA